MAKKKTIKPGDSVEGGVAVPTPAGEATPQILDQPVYSFPTKSRCPRCGSLDTGRRSEHGDTQYRVCRVTVCRKNFAVKGTPL